jgi:hypothetical protein
MASRATKEFLDPRPSLQQLLEEQDRVIDVNGTNVLPSHKYLRAPVIIARKSATPELVEAAPPPQERAPPADFVGGKKFDVGDVIDLALCVLRREKERGNRLSGENLDKLREIAAYVSWVDEGIKVAVDPDVARKEAIARCIRLPALPALDDQHAWTALRKEFGAEEKPVAEGEGEQPAASSSPVPDKDC